VKLPRFTKSSFTYAAIALALIGVLVVLVAKTRSVDFDLHNEIIGDLRSLKQIDAEWNADVLRSKMGLNNNYDPVASALPNIERLNAALTDRTTDAASGQSQTRDRILKLLDDHRKLMDGKTAVIEQFKSQNSILRNSLHYC
jgi:two-component system, NtrC family, sensor kinase